MHEAGPRRHSTGATVRRAGSRFAQGRGRVGARRGCGSCASAAPSRFAAWVSRRCGRRSGASPTSRRSPRRRSGWPRRRRPTPRSWRRAWRIPAAAARIVILNGHFAPELSSIGALPDGCRRRQPGAGDRRTIGPSARTCASAADSTRHSSRSTRRFSRTARSSSSRPTSIVERSDPRRRHQRRRRPTMAHPRTLIVAGANSQARIAQTFLGAAGETHFTNAVTEVTLGENATRRSLHRSARDRHRVSHRVDARAARSAARRSGRAR